ncbi:MAG: fimbrillin family protein, partial [Tannerella sp.]|nr:fimbrillin family protein [Tannerella sp.]
MNHSFSNLSAGCCRLIALAASLLLPAVSCTDETAERGGVTPPPETPSAGAIRFHSSAFDPKTATKTPVIDGNNITNFKVSANLPNPSDPGQTHAGKNSFNFFDGLNVLRVGGYWDYSPSMYWPNDTDTLSFYAYSPAGSVNLSGFVSHMYDFPAVDNAVMSYRVPHTPGPMADSVGTGALSPEDLLFAKVKWRESMGDTVPLIFRHALSIVTFAARNTTQDLDVTIQRIQLIHLKTRSTLDLSQDFTNDSVYWTPATEPADYVAGIPLQGDGSYAISLPPKGAQAQYISLTSPNEGMPVMPQGFPVYSGGGVSIITKPVVIDDINAPEPDQPGILVTYMARNSVQLVAPSGTRAFYPFAKLYKDPNYGGKP